MINSKLLLLLSLTNLLSQRNSKEGWSSAVEPYTLLSNWIEPVIDLEVSSAMTSLALRSYTNAEAHLAFLLNTNINYIQLHSIEAHHNNLKEYLHGYQLFKRLL